MRYSLKRFGIALRSLALFRGIMALTVVLAVFTVKSDASLSMNALQTSPFVNGFLVLLVSVLGLLLLVGYRTRLMSVLCFLACGLATLLGVGQFGLISGILLPILFWSGFLPLGAAYSLDSAMNTQKSLLPTAIVSGATVALMVQHSLNYWLPKALFWSTLVATTEPGAVGNVRSLLWVLGLLSPLLVLISLRLNFYRSVLVAAFVCIHAIAILVLRQPAVLHLLAIALWTIYLPCSFWEALAERVNTPARQGISIYYDADCGFCKKVVHVLRTLLILPSAPLATAQSDPSICADMETYNSWVVVDWQQKRHFKFEAIAYICSLSPVFRVVAPILRWHPVMSAGTRFYEAIANNRRRAGLLTKPLTFHASSIASSQLENWIVGVCFVTYFASRLPLLIEAFKILP